MIENFETGKSPILSWVTGLEKGAFEQAFALARLPYVHGPVALMADCHMGMGMPIGGVMATKDVVVPNAVGADQGCGMVAVKTSLTEITRDQLLRIVGGSKEFRGGIKGLIPVGRAKHREAQLWDGFRAAPYLTPVQDHLQNAMHQLGTLGGGKLTASSPRV